MTCKNHETLEGLKFGMCECSYKRYRAQMNAKKRGYMASKGPGYGAALVKKCADKFYKATGLNYYTWREWERKYKQGVSHEA